MIIFNALFLILGFILLIYGANIFVDASSNITKKLRVSPLIIGLTIVSIRISAPEFSVSIIAMINKSHEISISNVIGSNIFNLLMVLGISSLNCHINIEEKIIRRDMPVSILTIFIVMFFSCYKFIISLEFLKIHNINEIVGSINYLFGIILLIIFFIYIMNLIINSKSDKDTYEDIKSNFTYKKCFLFLIVGITMIIIGGEVVVSNAKAIARMFNLSETLIGLTIVAIGKSLPELVTSLVDAKKKEAAIAIGNVLGSNIFNILVISAFSSFINPIKINFSTFLNMLLLFISTLLVYSFCINNRKINRINDIVMILIYIFISMFAVIQ